MTRTEVARALGVTLTRVRALETSGKLSPVADTRGVHTFDRREVAAYVRTRPARRQLDGKIAAVVFRMIRDGFALNAIVIETEQSPETIRKLFAEYRRPFVPVTDALADHFDRSARELDDDVKRKRGHIG
jgi:hypothetical protein